MEQGSPRLTQLLDPAPSIEDSKSERELPLELLPGMNGRYLNSKNTVIKRKMNAMEIIKGDQSIWKLEQEMISKIRSQLCMQSAGKKLLEKLERSA